ncbi:MAG TPA: hypothetical protein VJH34_01760 [archaeon]|nr:hypothetical protein [archaeon]
MSELKELLGSLEDLSSRAAYHAVNQEPRLAYKTLSDLENMLNDENVKKVLPQNSYNAFLERKTQIENYMNKTSKKRTEFAKKSMAASQVYGFLYSAENALESAILFSSPKEEMKYYVSSLDFVKKMEAMSFNYGIDVPQRAVDFKQKLEKAAKDRYLKHADALIESKRFPEAEDMLNDAEQFIITLTDKVDTEDLDIEQRRKVIRESFTRTGD